MNLLDAEKTCLVIIDMQDAFLKNIFERERLEQNVKILVQAAKVCGLPIVSTVQYPEKMGYTIESISGMIPDEKPVCKTTFSCVGSGDFDKRIKHLAPRQILVCGVESHICVSQTVIELLGQGYEVHFCADAISSRTKANWKLGLGKMQQAGAAITGTETAVFELIRDASTKQFKEMLPWIK